MVINKYNNTSAQIKTNQTDSKDTNFEYEDNEWDIGKRKKIEKLLIIFNIKKKLQVLEI